MSFFSRAPTRWKMAASKLLRLRIESTNKGARTGDWTSASCASCRSLFHNISASTWLSMRSPVPLAAICLRWTSVARSEVLFSGPAMADPATPAGGHLRRGLGGICQLPCRIIVQRFRNREALAHWCCSLPVGLDVIMRWCDSQAASKSNRAIGSKTVAAHFFGVKANLSRPAFWAAWADKKAAAF